jgi:hypothetical protein
MINELVPVLGLYQALLMYGFNPQLSYAISNQIKK